MVIYVSMIVALILTDRIRLFVYSGTEVIALPRLIIGIPGGNANYFLFAWYINAGQKLRGSKAMRVTSKYLRTSLRFWSAYWYWTNLPHMHSDASAALRIWSTHSGDILPRGSVDITISTDHSGRIWPIWAALISWISQYCPYSRLSDMIHVGSFSMMMSFVPGDLCSIRCLVNAPYPAPSSTIVPAPCISAIVMTRRASHRDDPSEYPISDQNLRVQHLRFINRKKYRYSIDTFLNANIFVSFGIQDFSKTRSSRQKNLFERSLLISKWLRKNFL